MENPVHIGVIVRSHVNVQGLHLPQKPPEHVRLYPQGGSVVADILENQFAAEAGTIFFICFPQPLRITMGDIVFRREKGGMVPLKRQQNVRQILIVQGACLSPAQVLT